MTVCFVVFLFRRDSRERPNVTGALWLPLIWLLLMGSRSAAQWLSTFGFQTVGSLEEGTPLDAAIYSSLIVVGLCVLSKRQVSIAEVLQNNGWLMAFLLYCFLAIFWSDFAFVAFKRWIKVLGHPIMVLVLFSEPDPKEALVRLMKRSAYVLVPFSILAIKYYPEIGRQFDQWTGLSANSGISHDKNGLGCGCLVLGLFFFCHLLTTWSTRRDIVRRNELRLIIAFLIMIAWLLRKSHDATATLCLLIAIVVVLGLRLTWVNTRLIGIYLLMALVALVVAEFAFGILERVGEFVGHQTTLMGRMVLWRQLLAMHTNPVVGVGFESFWLGDRLDVLGEGRATWRPDESHNGYIETYLNLGLVGLFMLFGLIVVTFRKIGRELFRNPDWGRFRLGFLAAMVFYNITEATFKGLSLTWFIFFIIAMEYPIAEYESLAGSSEMDGLEEESELTYLPG